MKKCLCILMVIAFVIGITACSAPLSPEEVALRYMTASIKYKYSDMAKYGVVDPKLSVGVRIKNEMEAQDMSENEVFEMFAEMYEFEKTPQNIDEYMNMYSAYLDSRDKKLYGDDCSVEVSVVGSVDFDEDELLEALQTASDRFDEKGISVSDIADFSKIKQAKKVSMKAYLSGEKVKDEKPAKKTFMLVLINNNWKVMNINV